MALSQGMHRARQLRCRACPGGFAVLKPGLWKWIKCEGKTPAFDLDTLFMRNEASDCPKGYWSALVEVDLDQEAFEGRETWRLGAVAGIVPALRKLIDWLLTKFTADELGPAIVDLCASWVYPTFPTARVLEDKGLHARVVAFAKAVCTRQRDEKSVAVAQGTLQNLWEGGLLTAQEANQIKTDLGL